MASTERWQRGPVPDVSDALQPVARTLLHARESVGDLVPWLAATQWNARPAGAASAAFHARPQLSVTVRAARADKAPQ
jgi:hypothetical protein